MIGSFFVSVLGVLTVLTASAGLSAPFCNAAALRGCTEEDAPALEIYLTQQPFDGQRVPAKRYIHIEIAGTDWQHLVGKDLDLVPLSRHGLDPHTPIVRADLEGERLPPVWLSGSLRLKSAQPDRPVEGSYDFTAPSDAERRAGAFKASWVKTRGTGCG